MKKESFVLHFRLTKSCNANCSYCSSAMQTKLKPMAPAEAITSAQRVVEYWRERRIQVKYLTIEYVGGEVTLIDDHDLEEIVYGVRNVFQKEGISVHDGVQSNLIASKRKIDLLFKLFDGRVGTSIDNFTGERKLGSSSRRYLGKLNQSFEHINDEYKKTIPAVITIDSNNISYIPNEIELAQERGRNIVIRPVFQGGSSVSRFTDEELTKLYLDCFDKWFLESTIIVDPFFTLLSRFVKNDIENYCSWQNDCINNSLSVEPNGDLYLCQEMADFGYGKLGNSLTGDINKTQVREFSKRTSKMYIECGTCPYFTHCQGGCMVNSVERGLSIHTKTPYCTTWKMLFKKMEEKIEENGKEKTITWLESLEK